MLSKQYRFIYISGIIFLSSSLSLSDHVLLFLPAVFSQPGRAHTNYTYVEWWKKEARPLFDNQITYDSRNDTAGIWASRHICMQSNFRFRNQYLNIICGCFFFFLSVAFYFLFLLFTLFIHLKSDIVLLPIWFAWLCAFFAFALA